MAISHQWQNRYRAPIPGGAVISTEKPGEKIARAVTEIQGVIDSLLGQDGKGNDVLTRSDVDSLIVTDGASVGQVYQITSAGTAGFDWVRAKA